MHVINKSPVIQSFDFPSSTNTKQNIENWRRYPTHLKNFKTDVDFSKCVLEPSDIALPNVDGFPYWT